MSSQIAKIADPQYFTQTYKINSSKHLLVAFVYPQTKQKYLRTVGQIHKINYSERYTMTSGSGYCKVFFFTVSEPDTTQHKTYVLAEDHFYIGKPNDNYVPICSKEDYENSKKHYSTGGKWLKKILGNLPADVETEFSTSPIPSPAPQKANASNIQMLENTYDPSQDVDEPMFDSPNSDQQISETGNVNPVSTVASEVKGKKEVQKPVNKSDDVEAANIVGATKGI